VPSLAGLEFDDYTLLEEIGRGGMGVVYKARQKSLDRPVAVKLLLAEHFAKPSLLTRFLAEARAAASLAHPNIVSVYQVGQCPAGHYFAMELIEGLNLEELTQREGRRRPAPILWAVSVMIPVAQAVHFAHSRGVIHRDLKPANVMIDAHKRPVVMDFGIAKVTGTSAGLTQQGTIMGTPAYMSPEQAGEELGRVGPPSDVYSLGAILYTLLTGRLTYEASTTLLTILKVISEEMPAPVRALRPDVSPALEEVVMKCLAKDPARRYPSAKALALALVEELGRLRDQPAPAKPRSPSASDSHRPLAAPPKTPAPLPLPAVALVVAKTGKQVRLTRPVTVIGRASDCEIILRVADVSKQHCRLLLEPGKVVLEDLNSANGTFVNGRAVERAVLNDGDRVQVADYSFTVRFLQD
jgi:serine/threonine protein kinase